MPLRPIQLPQHRYLICSVPRGSLLNTTRDFKPLGRDRIVSLAPHGDSFVLRIHRYLPDIAGAIFRDDADNIILSVIGDERKTHATVTETVGPGGDPLI